MYELFQSFSNFTSRSDVLPCYDTFSRPTDDNNCWEYCYDRDDYLSDQLVNIVSKQGLDGINIDYEHCYDIDTHQNGKCLQKTRKYSDAKAQGFLYRLTAGLRDKLDDLQASNGHVGRYELSHSPIDEDLLPHSSYYQILKMRNDDLTFLMPKFYNGVTRPRVDGTSGGSYSAVSIFHDLAANLFDNEPEKVRKTL